MSLSVTSVRVLRFPRELGTHGPGVSSLLWLISLHIAMSRPGPAPSRGGRGHVLRHEGEVRRRRLDWLSCLRAGGCQERAATRPPGHRRCFCCAPRIHDQPGGRSCKILPFSPLTMLLRPFVSFIHCLRMRTVLTWTPGVVLLPRLLRSPVLIRCARPFPFPSTSGAGRSGLRPSHVRDALRPASSDLLLRLLSEVVCLMVRFRRRYAHMFAEPPSSSSQAQWFLSACRCR